MATQSYAAVSGPTVGKLFSLNATESVWNGNNLIDDVSSSNLGLILNGQMVNEVTMTQASGCGLFRVIDRVSQKIQRIGFTSQTMFPNPQGYSINPYQVSVNDLLQIYPVGMNATAGDSEVLCWIHTSRGPEAFSVTTAEDNTLTSMTSIQSNEELGTYFGSTLTGFQIQCEANATNAAVLNKVSIIAPDGGVIWSCFGTLRNQGNYYLNADVTGLNIPIVQGMKIQVAVTTGS
jgi:hypothetical protein